MPLPDCRVPTCVGTSAAYSTSSEPTGTRALALPPTSPFARAHNRTAGPVLLAARTFVLSRTTPVAYTMDSAIEKRDPLNDQIEGMLAVAGSGLGGLGREPY